MRLSVLTPILAAALLATSPAAAQETAVPVTAQRDLALTVYSGGFAVVQDTRGVRVLAGENLLAWEEVSPQVQRDTAMFTRAAGPDMTLVEQTFDFDLLTPARLIEHSVGREVTIVRLNPVTGEEVRVTARVLSTNSGVILRIGDRYHVNAPGRIVFHDLPEGLRTQPTLLARIDSEAAGEAELRLTYHAGGVIWAANYVGHFEEAAGRLWLESRVMLANQSGIAFRNAALRLVAGEVRQPQASAPRDSGARMRMAAAEDVSELPSGGADFHIYEVARRVTLENNQTRQIGFLENMTIDVTPEYRFDGAQQYYRGRFDGPVRSNAALWLTFDNEETSGAGRALAAGTVRVYRDIAGQQTYMGGDTIPHTPVGEEVRLHLANAFDVTGERVQTEFELVRPRNRNEDAVIMTAFRLTFRNAKERDIQVIVTEPIPGDWQMMSESAQHRRISSNRVEWRITVPAGGEAELTYRVRYR